VPGNDIPEVAPFWGAVADAVAALYRGDGGATTVLAAAEVRTALAGG
jgi:hypothetical protein